MQAVQLQAMWASIVASQLDLLMIAMGLASYMFLFQARTSWKAAGAQKHFQQKVSDLSPSIVVKHDHETHSKQVKLADKTYSLRIKAANGNRAQTRDIIEEVLDRPVGATVSFDLVISILGFCRMSNADRPMVDSLLQRMQTLDMDILSEFIHFYLDSNQLEKACDVFELNFAAFFDNELGEDTEWTLMTAALKCRRLSLASHLFETSHVNATRHVVKIQRWWKRVPCEMRTSSREHAVSDVFGRLAMVFNERFPFEEDSNVDSNDESTVFLGDEDDDDDDRRDSDFDSDYDGNNWTVDH